MSRARTAILSVAATAFALVPSTAAAAPDSPCQSGGLKCVMYRVNCILDNGPSHLGPCVWPE